MSGELMEVTSNGIWIFHIRLWSMTVQQKRINP